MGVLLGAALLAGCGGAASDAPAAPFVYERPGDRLRIAPEDGGRIVALPGADVRFASGAGRWVGLVGDRLLGAGLQVRVARTGAPVALRFPDGLDPARVAAFAPPSWDAAGTGFGVLAGVPGGPASAQDPLGARERLALVRCEIDRGTCTTETLAEDTFAPKVGLAGISGASGPLLYRVPETQPAAAALPTRCGGPRTRRVRGGIVRVAPQDVGAGGWRAPAVLEGLVDGPFPGEAIGADVGAVPVGDGALLADVPGRALLLRGVRCRDGVPEVEGRSVTGAQRARLRVRRGEQTVTIGLPGPLSRADGPPTRYVLEPDGGALLLSGSRVWRYRPGENRLGEITALSAAARRALDDAGTVLARTGARGDLVVRRADGWPFGPIQRVPLDGRPPETLVRRGRLIG